MKKLVLIIVACSAIFLSLTAENMDDNGKAGFTGAPGELDCTDCHDTYALNSGGGSVTLTSTNMTGWMYDPGVTYHMIATVSRSQNSLFGICVEALLPTNANAGTLVITNSTLTQIKTKTVTGVSRRSVVHKLDAGQGTGSFSFEFDWTAPATNAGDVTFYFAGNATDANGDEFGDYVYNSSQVVSYNLNNSISELKNNGDISIYPMPIQDQFTVNYDLNSTGAVNINLYTMQGALVSNLTSKVMTSGKHSDKFYLPTQLSAGNYILSIESKSGISSRKILIN
ncbi:MAG: T9SS type A sorting domain-containing protein [Bacteroidetes bacterium]|nr:T9SS type A sorting domain-containing protein [Bacteroidota bacterium]